MIHRIHVYGNDFRVAAFLYQCHDLPFVHDDGRSVVTAGHYGSTGINHDIVRIISSDIVGNTLCPNSITDYINGRMSGGLQDKPRSVSHVFQHAASAVLRIRANDRDTVIYHTVGNGFGIPEVAVKKVLFIGLLSEQFQRLIQYSRCRWVEMVSMSVGNQYEVKPLGDFVYFHWQFHHRCFYFASHAS